MLINGGWGNGAATDIAMSTVSQYLAYSSAKRAEVPGNGAGGQSAYAPTRRAQWFMTSDGKFHSRWSQSEVVLDTETPWAIHYTNKNEPPYPVTKVNNKTGDVTVTSDDVNAIQRDVCHVAGFVSGDETRPYMRHTASNNVIELQLKVPASGGVGTYAFARIESGNTSIDFGVNIAGSVLRASCGDGTGGGSALAGTWRCCGATWGLDWSSRVTLWIRIA